MRPYLAIAWLVAQGYFYFPGNAAAVKLPQLGASTELLAEAGFHHWHVCSSRVTACEF